MKNIYIFLLVIPFLLLSCSDKEERNEPGNGTREVEIEIAFTAKGATRTPKPDEGIPAEKFINELDLIVLDNSGKFLYTREAYKLSSGNYRATFEETSETLKVYFMANCRTQVNANKDNWTPGTSVWTNIYADLIDTNPARLVNSAESQPLPMWGEHSGQVSTTQVNKWGPIVMLRSVASADLYVEDNAKNSDFELKALHLYYASNKGYLPAVGATSTTPIQYAVPADMKTNLNTLKAIKVGTITVEPGTPDQKVYTSISHQMYMYDNDVTTAVTADKKHTRIIMEGYYKQGSIPESSKKKSFYPIDFVYDDGQFRPLIRNWKYEFKISGVNGKGYETIEEAADNYPIDLDVEVIDWNQEEGEIGVSGRYYVEIPRKLAVVSRDANSTDEIELTYRIEDLVPGNEFKLEFETTANGEGTDVTNGIQSDYFKVELIHHPSGKSATLKVTALQNYTTGHDKDRVIIKFRDLKFKVDIFQLDSDDADWIDGGNIEHEF